MLVVARFLALLELYREGAVTFEQVDPLGELHIRWTGTDEGEIEVPDEFEDDAEGRADSDGGIEDQTAETDETDDTAETSETDETGRSVVSDDSTIDLRETRSDD
jgi:segregation and condensation protein A